MTQRAFLQDIERLARPGRALSGLPMGAAAWAAVRLARGAEHPLLLVVPGRDDADRMLGAVRFHATGPDGEAIDPARIRAFPADDVRTWDGLSPHPEIPRARLASLHLLRNHGPGIVVAPARALQHRVLPPEVLDRLTLRLRSGTLIDRDELVRRLTDRGYLVTQAVAEPGTLAVRGAVVDLWATGADLPVRIELFDDEVDDIHVIDPMTGRSAIEAPVEELVVLPAREAVLTPAGLRRIARVTAECVDRMGGGQATRRRVIQDLKEGLWFPGAEDYLAALHPVVDPLSWVRGPVVMVAPDAIIEELHRFEALAAARWEAIEVEDRPLVPPELRFASARQVEAALGEAIRMAELVPDAPDLGAHDNEGLRVGPTGDLEPLVGRLRHWVEEGWRITIACDTRSRAERMTALFGPHGLPLRTVAGRGAPRPLGLVVQAAAPAPEPWEGPSAGEIVIRVGALPVGFHAPRSQLAWLAEDELFTPKQRPVTHGTRFSDAVVRSFSELKVGDLVVHRRHGIGRFLGLKRVDVPVAEGPYGQMIGVPQDMAEVEYRGGDRLFLPVTRLEELARYRAIGHRPPRLDKLGGQTWARRKAKVRDKVLAMAADLLRLHASRAVARGYAYTEHHELYDRFEAAFPFVETPDQEAAIRDVLCDLARPEPMDRLIVGDVGFGKTEVAMRAAMRVVLEGRQVAVLCPTTVLAFQHDQTFHQRFDDFGVEVALVSRLAPPAQNRETLKRLAEGRIDVLIGTHALLGRDVRFKNLGLVVVDEEHRFGVRQKEQLKRLAVSSEGIAVDYLAMSATPIPRTLHMAMSGLRSVSLIATPPAGRQPVVTRVSRFRGERVREEILHELKRGGQVFFVHNRIHTIERIAHHLQRLVPEARFGIAHGQMDERELDKVLVDFVRRRFHVLVCTTIIESGVDMPSVNTILVNQAHTLGLAELHQLRGRVGRGTVRGYCTLLVPDERRLTKDAARRLRTLQEHSALGSGFAIATVDLEIRGAGNLLGEAQHGNIQAVGLDTYVELLEEATAHARGELARHRLDPEIEVPVPSLLPEDYIPDVEDRLHEYRRLASAQTVEQVRDLIDDWEHTYGPPPPPALNLGWNAETRLCCRALGIERVRWMKVRVALDFHDSTPVSGDRIVKLVSEEPKRFQVTRTAGGTIRLIVRFTPQEAEWPFRFLHWVFRRLDQ